MKYFLMNNSYDWVEVEQADYRNPPADMINNKASVGSDALVTIAVANIGLDSLAALTDKLSKGWRLMR